MSFFRFESSRVCFRERGVDGNDRFVAEGLGAVVNWNPKDAQIGTGAVTVYYPK